MKRKAKIVVCALQKGGVGKSSVVRNLSFALFQRGVRVCMVDFDPQANLTMSCGIDKPNEIPITIGHLMDAEIKGTERPNKEDYIRSSDGVDFIPSSNYLSAIEFDMRLEIGCERLLGFVLEDIREDYDYIIIDIGPTEGTLSANALTCSDGILIPSDLQLFSMAGVSQVLTTSIKLRRRVNRNAHKSTRYYADEFHLLIREEQTAAYSVEIWKRFRKWGGIPTALTQNVKDLLSSPEIENILENSDFVYLLNQASGDREILAKRLTISTHQLSYVTNSNEGEGLLFYGNVIVPFVDRFPKNTKLYQIMTTKPNEKGNSA